MIVSRVQCCLAKRANMLHAVQLDSTIYFKVTLITIACLGKL